MNMNCKKCGKPEPRRYTVAPVWAWPGLCQECALKAAEQERVLFMRQRITAFAQTLEMPPVVHSINDLVNRQMWAEAEAKEREAMHLISEMWQIVKAVAEMEPHFYNDHNGSYECIFCGHEHETSLACQSRYHIIVNCMQYHTKDCIYREAIALVDLLQGNA